MRNLAGQIVSLWGDRKCRVLMLLVLSTLAYSGWRFSQDPRMPGMKYAKGIYGWSDQKAYLEIADHLFDGRLRKPHYSFGYPVLASPFMGSLENPFLPANVLLLTATTILLFLALVRIKFGLLPSFLLTLLALMSGTYSDYFVYSFSNCVSIFAVAAVLYLLVATRDSPVRTTQLFVASALVGWTLASRYVDFVPIALAYGVLFYRKSDRRLLDWLSPLPLLVFAGLLLWFHSVYFESPWTTPYVHHSRLLNARQYQDTGLGAYFLWKVPRTFYEIYFNPFLLNSFQDVGGFQGVSYRLPVLVLGLVGLPLAVPKVARGMLEATALVLGWLAVNGLYLAFWANSATELRFHSARYLAPFLPLYILALALCLRSIVDGRFAWLKKPLAAVWVGVVALLCAFPLFEWFSFRFLHQNERIRVVRASHNAPHIDRIIDGDLDRKWQSKTHIRPGVWIALKFDSSIRVAELVFKNNHSRKDFPDRVQFVIVPSRGAEETWVDARRITMTYSGAERRFRFHPPLEQVKDMTIMAREAKSRWWTISELLVR